jgi:hypothetical protein
VETEASTAKSRSDVSRNGSLRFISTTGQCPPLQEKPRINDIECHEAGFAETSQCHQNAPVPFLQLNFFNFFAENFHYSDKSRYFGSDFPIGCELSCIQGKCHVSLTA